MGLIPKKKQPAPPTPIPQPQEQTPQPAEPESVWRVEKIAVQTEPVIYNSKEDRVYTLVEAVVEILNRTEE